MKHTTIVQTHVQPTVQPTSVPTNSASSFDDFGGTADEFVFNPMDLKDTSISDESHHEQPPPLPADTPGSGGHQHYCIPCNN